MGKRVNKRKRKYIPRNTIQFQMNLTDETDREVIRIYESAAQERLALQMFRDGMRLMHGLRNNDTSILFALFPDMREILAPKNSELVEQFRQMIESKFQQLPLPGMQTGGLKSLAGAKTIAMPTFSESDEDEDANNIVLVRNPKAAETTMLNFLASVQGINE